MYKVVVYSCVTGGYDKLEKTLLAARPKIDCNTEFYVFTENNSSLVDSVWQTKALACKLANPRKTSRWHKINSHLLFPEADITVWVDGSQKFKSFRLFNEFIEPYLKTGIATFKHPDRKCIYQEYQACCHLNKDHKPTMKNQVDKYRAAGYPINNGLVETSCVIRENTKQVAGFNELWWNEVDKHSIRDQLSFNYVSWLTKTPYSIIPGCRVNSPFFSFSNHSVNR